MLLHPALVASVALALCSGCPALQEEGGGDDEVGGEGLCSQECEERFQCVYTQKEKPKPEDWEAGPAFCADGMYEGLDPVARAVEFRHDCKLLKGLEWEGAADFRFFDCPSSPSGYDCSGWSPASAVRSITTTTFHVDRSLVEALIGDPTPLSACDTARFSISTDDVGYVVGSPSRDDLVYVLGLREGDRIISLNQHFIEDYSDALGALIYFSEHGENEYELTIERGAEQLSFRYEIIQ
ncbi:MAG: hypothetical protein HC927_02435 [Deltaproteobacteria bacterium]|nr:hypothetical protein [Deltaproteobacteria bacterium]